LKSEILGLGWLSARPVAQHHSDLGQFVIVDGAW
jgi:hypothetical protein